MSRRVTSHSPHLAVTICILGGLVLLARPSVAATTTPLSPPREADWRFVSGQWRVDGNTLEQQNPERLGAAILKTPAFADFTLTTEFNIRPEGKGVRAAAIIFRASGTLSYYWVHLDSKFRQVIMTRSTPENTWLEIGRKHCDALTDDAWHTVKVTCAGAKITVALDDAEVIAVTDDKLQSGCVGLGTSQGRVAFRNLKIEGEVQPMTEPLRDETPPYKIISRGSGAAAGDAIPPEGSYQAFPDSCRLRNGDIVAVFYAGYGHVSLPTAQYPKGGRICLVRSRDEGRTWSAPRVLYDDENDNRDPHIAQLSDGTLICSFFSLKAEGKSYKVVGCQITRSTDGGETWETPARTLTNGDWALSAPVREMPDGTLILGVYYCGKDGAWGGVLRSTDRGKTWSEPIDIGKEAKQPLDAETDVILLRDGTLYAALRSSSVNMYYATSPDLGLTWSPAKDIGFKGHAPHFTRLSSGEILMTHRVPETALHVSRDECKTWQGPYILDTVGGAYPSTVELKDHTVLAIYYEEGEDSAIRALRFRLKADGVERLTLD